MLRQALDDAAKQEHNQRSTQAEDLNQGESQRLLRNNPHEQSYASMSAQIESEAGSSYEDEYLVGSWQEDDNSIQEPTQSSLERLWHFMKSCFVLVVNVEQLWDSPSQAVSPEISRRKHYIVFFWFFILASSYATERTSFKFLVDQSGPFRLFAVQVLTFCHAFMLGLGMFISAVSRKDFSIGPLGIPVVDVGLMALLDTIQMLLVFLPGSHVAPTMTVILVQFTLPLTALITQFVHPDGCVKRRCCPNASSLSESNMGTYQGDGNTPTGFGGLSVEHVLGSVIITLAVLLALCPAFYSIWDPDFFVYADTVPMRTCLNTIVFLSSCIPAAASQLYKEHIFLQYKQPVQQDFLNFILSVLQFIFASIMSPLVYTLLGLAASDDWPSRYPSSDFSKNVGDGLWCFLGVLSERRAKHEYDDEAQCKYVFGLTFLNAFSIIAVGVAVDKIVNAGATRVMYRGVSAGIIVSVISLYIYDLHIPDFSYGPAIDSLNLVCVLLLVVGSEVYHRVSMQDATFETIYPEVENFYEDMEE